MVGGDDDSIRFLVFTIGYSNHYFPKMRWCTQSERSRFGMYWYISRVLSLVLPLHYELLDAFIPLNMPILNELCCCCWICCCCCCCWLFAWRPCFGTGGCRYSCLASVNTSIRSSFLYARQLLMKLCNSKLSRCKIALIYIKYLSISILIFFSLAILPLLRC